MAILIGVGAQKAGTTWIADYLSKHPQFTISPGKELHYFDGNYSQQNRGAMRQRYWLKKTIRTHLPLLAKQWSQAPAFVALYLGMLAGRDASYVSYLRRLEAVTGYGGEITPCYSILDKAGFAQIRKAVPDARILFIMRNPADRLWSQLRFIETVNRESAVDQALDVLANDNRFRLRSRYRDTMNSLREVFNEEQLLFLFYEDLFSEKGEDVVRTLCAFIGINFVEPDLGRQVNVSRAISLNSAERLRLVEALAHEYRAAQEIFGAALPASWQADLEALSS